MKSSCFRRIYYILFINCRQIIRALCGQRRASSGNSSSLQVSMYIEQKGCTDEHIIRIHTNFRWKICACIRERCAVLGDKWVVLDTDCVSRTIHLSPSTMHRSQTQAHTWHLDCENSVTLCLAVHPEQYWVHGRAIAVASILMCHVWILLAY